MLHGLCQKKKTKKNGEKKLSNVFSGWEVDVVINVWKCPSTHAGDAVVCRGSQK